MLPIEEENREEIKAWFILPPSHPPSPSKKKLHRILPPHRRLHREKNQENQRPIHVQTREVLRGRQEVEMNHNKLEAIQYKGIAEKMIISEDYMGARDKLLQAEKLFPSLENITSMLSVCDILSAASIRFPGSGIDYYWVLQLQPSANESDLKCQYQKIVSLLKPINNKFPGTDLALKLAEESFLTLSDRDKRSAFELKRVESWDSCKALCSQDEFANKERLVATPQSSSADKRPEVSDESNEQDVQRDLLFKGPECSGTNLIANNNFVTEKISFQEASCSSAQVKEVFRGANDTSSSIAAQSSSLNSNVAVQKNLKTQFCNFENNRKDEVFEVGQIWAANYRMKMSPRYARIDFKSKSELSVTWLKPVPFTPDERRWCEAGFPVACGSFELDPEMSEVEVSGPKMFSQSCSWVHGVTEEQFDIYPKAGEVWAIYKDWDLSEWPSNPDSMKKCKLKIVEILSDYSKYVGALVTCLVKVDGFGSIFKRDLEEESNSTFSILPNNLYMFSHKLPAFRFTGGEMDGIEAGMFELDPLALPNCSSTLKNLEEGCSSNLSTLIHSSADFSQVKSIPNTHSLKLSWSIGDFKIGQVWAIYSGADAMPRRYTLINNVVSDNQVRVTFLEPHPIMNFEIQWEKENLPIACGIFKVGKTTVNLEMSWFSHSVKCQRSTDRYFYKIYPRKGEIWAMYRFWNKKWNQFNYNSYQCRVVEILSDFSEENGVKVGRLIEVKGCMTFFQRHFYDGFELTRTVSKAEMLSFSHRIPSFTVPGIERYGIPASSLHLEPDALPPRLGPNSHP